jgi:hypothetical protein
LLSFEYVLIFTTQELRFPGKTRFIGLILYNKISFKAQTLLIDDLAISQSRNVDDS